MNERIKEFAEQAGYSEKVDWYREYDKFDLEHFAELVAAAEREACAKVCEGYQFDYAKAIRARGDKHE